MDEYCTSAVAHSDARLSWRQGCTANHPPGQVRSLFSGALIGEIGVFRYLQRMHDQAGGERQVPTGAHRVLDQCRGAGLGLADCVGE